MLLAVSMLEKDKREERSSLERSLLIAISLRVAASSDKFSPLSTLVVIVDVVCFAPSTIYCCWPMESRLF